MVLLVGLDAASDLSKFGFAIGYYDGSRVSIKETGIVNTLDQDSVLHSLIAPRLDSASRALIAIDAPLGWPAALSSELHTHMAGKAFGAKKDAMFQRETDRFVREKIEKRPLEVGADKIARAAHSALEVLKILRNASGKAIPLAWNSDFVGVAAIEVYPGGTLKARGLQDSGYKKQEQIDVRRNIADSLAGEIEGLMAQVNKKIDEFDACLCLVAAKDFLDGLAYTPTDMKLAKQEGWIWIKKV